MIGYSSNSAKCRASTQPRFASAGRRGALYYTATNSGGDNDLHRFARGSDQLYTTACRYFSFPLELDFIEMTERFD